MSDMFRVNDSLVDSFGSGCWVVYNTIKDCYLDILCGVLDLCFLFHGVDTSKSLLKPWPSRFGMVAR